LELFAGHLAVLPLFRGLTPLQIAGMARHAERVSYTPGATIIEQDAIADAAILIVSGTAARVSGPEIDGRREPVVPGSLLGEAAMLVETTYGSTIVARTAVRAVHITRAALHDQMLLDPDLAGRIAANLGKRLAETANILRQVDARLGTGPLEMPIAPPGAELEMAQATAG
jgi:CRP-like cAMP-binding protein